MSNPLKGVDYDRWYVVFIVMAFMGCMGALAAGKMLVLGLCFGFLLIGFGELIMHPVQRTYIGHWEIEGMPRRWYAGGILFDVLGAVVAIWFAVLLVRDAGVF